MKHGHRKANPTSNVDRERPSSGALNIRSIGTHERLHERYCSGRRIQRICRIPHRSLARVRMHTIDRTCTDVHTDARCTQNSGWPFIFVGSIYFRSLAACARTRASESEFDSAVSSLLDRFVSRSLSLFLSLSLSL